MPHLSDQFIDSITKRYIELYEKFTSSDFVGVEVNQDELFSKTTEALNKLYITTP